MPHSLTSKPSLWRRIYHSRPFKFVAIGLVSVALSLVVYDAILEGPDDIWRASMARWLVLFVCNYVGYSRWMLRELLEEDRQRLGRARAEWRMLGRVLAAVGAANLAKVLIEPPLAHWLMTAYGHQWSLIAPLLGDFFYAPIINYALLMLLSPKQNRAADSEPT